MQKSKLSRFHRGLSIKPEQFKIQNDFSVKFLHFTLSFFILIFTFCITVTAYAQSPKIVYVSPDYAVGNTSGHSFGVDAFTKIQDGVNAVASGGIVRIEAGVYDEQIFIYRKNLTLEGAGDDTIIKPSSPDKLFVSYVYPEELPNRGGLTTTAVIVIQDVGDPGVQITNLAINGSGITKLLFEIERLSGILYGESSGIIKNTKIASIRTGRDADKTYGIDIVGFNNKTLVKVLGNRIENFTNFGIVAAGKNLTVDIQNNVIKGPIILFGSSQISNGIAAAHGMKGEIRENVLSRFHSPADSWQGSGIIISGEGFEPGTVMIEDNEIFDADYGITFNAGVSGVVARYNNLYDNKTGIMFESGAINNQITRNTIKNNIQGFQIHGQKSSNLTGNKPPGVGNTASNNIVADNVAGVASFDDTQSFDARNNWWGSESPDFAKLIIGSVLYDPWLKSKPVFTKATADKPVITTQPFPAPLTAETLKAPPTVSSKKVDDSSEKITEKISDDKSLLESAGQAGGPAELFDIQFLIDSGTVLDIKDIVARAVFESFGRVPTPVLMTFSILDKNGSKVLESTDTITVETSAVFVKKFLDADFLPPGFYTLRLHTLYNTDVEDIFEKPFTIVEKDKSKTFNSIFYFLGSIISIMIAFFVIKQLLDSRKVKV